MTLAAINAVWAVRLAATVNSGSAIVVAVRPVNGACVATTFAPLGVSLSRPSIRRGGGCFGTAIDRSFGALAPAPGFKMALT